MSREIRITIFDDERHVDGHISDDEMEDMLELIWSVVNSYAYTSTIEETDI